MPHERANGATFSIDQIGFIDFETRNTEDDLRHSGAYRYASSKAAIAVILVYAIGNGPIGLIAVDDFERGLSWDDFPEELRDHHAKVEAGDAVWCAWNSDFDRAIWNFTVPGAPYMAPYMIIDASVQATASGLPPDLARAAKGSGSTLKVEDGGGLINLFCTPKSRETPQSKPDQWERFRDYAVGDIAAMRSVFLGTRQLAAAEWLEFWAAGEVNDRGIDVDLDMAEHAAVLAKEDRVRSGWTLANLTGELVKSVTLVEDIKAWLTDVLPPEGKKILVTRAEELDDDGEIVKPAKNSLKRSKLEKLIAWCGDDQARSQIKQVLEIRRYGGSTTPAKFSKIQKQEVDGRLYGQYVFGGAPMTGRFSSRGVQIHNLARDHLEFEPDAIDAIVSDCGYDHLEELGGGMPVSRILSLLIRPTFIAGPGKVLVWSDWSQIEARVLPWLANTPQAQARLDIMREVDADPSIPDIYTRSAATISGIPIEQVDKAIRQRGKVSELALGFGGGVGALQAMGAGYGLYVSEEDARTIVERWRAANLWAVQFWGTHSHAASTGLWGAAMRAMEAPGTTQVAGRIKYTYLRKYLGGSLLCTLPSGRCLTYRDIRYERVPDLDDDDEIIGYSIKLRFSKGYYRSEIWHGTLCENVVQAVAADCMRGTIRRLVEQEYPVVGHTHDEIVLEVAEDDSYEAIRDLREFMQMGFDWSDGLPLMSEETSAYCYTKHEESQL